MKWIIKHWLVGWMLLFSWATYAQDDTSSEPGDSNEENTTAADESEVKERAHQLFLEGVAFFNQKRLDEAVVKFQSAYDLLPTWKIFYNIGQCEAGLKHYGRAITAFEKYLGLGGDEVEVTRQDEVLTELDRLKRMVGKVVVDGPEGYTIWIDGEEVGNSPLSAGAPVSIGIEHEVIARNTETNEIVNEYMVMVSGGEVLRLRITPPEEPEPIIPVEATVQDVPEQPAVEEKVVEPEVVEEQPEEPNVTEPTPEEPAVDQEAPKEPVPDAASDSLKSKKKIGPGLFIAALTTTVMAGATTGILAGVINSKWNDAQNEYNENPWTYDDSQENTIRTLQITSYVTAGLTAAALVATIVSIPFTRWHKDEAQSVRLNLSPFVGPSASTGIMFGGRF